MLLKNDSVKKGGPNVMSNSALAAVLEKVKELDVPRDIVERNIKRATEKGQEAYIEKIYEVSITLLWTHLGNLLFLKNMVVSSCFMRSSLIFNSSSFFYGSCMVMTLTLSCF